MTLSIWRFSHLTLALAASAFLIVAALTGAILSLEPVANRSQPYGNPSGETLPIATVIEALQSEYLEVISLERDNNDFFVASVLTMEGEFAEIYVDPATGKKTGNLIEQAPLFAFATTLHRSLFLDTTGRFMIGLVSVLLFLIACSGTVLVLQRQRSWKSFFTRIERTGFARFYHVFFGRLVLIPILIVSLTGSYLFLQRFGVIPETPLPDHHPKTLSGSPEQADNEGVFFKETLLNDVQAIEFPFSPDEEDYFLIKLHDRELMVHQYNGTILSEVQYPFSALASEFSLLLHTGRGSSWWSIALFLTALGVLFFIYSGFRISLQRRKGKLKSKVKKNEAEIVLLAGSETGSTLQMASMLQQALTEAGQSVFVAEMNAYEVFPRMKHLIVLTSTYGCGEPPANARQFTKRFSSHPPQQTFTFSVVGFGSFAYPDFCRFALDVDALLQRHPKGQQLTKAATIHNQSYPSFKKWASLWSGESGIPFNLPAERETAPIKTTGFQVLQRSVASEETGESFSLELKPEKRTRVQSGDLIGFFPPSDPQERQYSIGMTATGTIQLSIKRHDQGICSNYLHGLSPGTMVEAAIRPNPHFHFPKQAKKVIFIANGTGMAPFIGMLYENKKSRVDLYWGGRTPASFALYADDIQEHLNQQRLHSVQTIFSRDPEQSGYVYDLIRAHSEQLAQNIRSGAVILLCGSIAMQQDVMAVLEEICRQHLPHPLSHYQKRGQVKMDCY